VDRLWTARGRASLREIRNRLYLIHRSNVGEMIVACESKTMDRLHNFLKDESIAPWITLVGFLSSAITLYLTVHNFMQVDDLDASRTSTVRPRVVHELSTSRPQIDVLVERDSKSSVSSALVSFRNQQYRRRQCAIGNTADRRAQAQTARPKARFACHRAHGKKCLPRKASTREAKCFLCCRV